MKFHRIIFFSFLLIAAGSCSKSEFEELYHETENSSPEFREGISDEPLNQSTSRSGGIGIEVNSVPGGDVSGVLETDSIQILIKEVTDGDDEADKGDDSRKTE